MTVKRGQFVCTPGSLSVHQELQVELQLNPDARPLQAGYRGYFEIFTARLSGRLSGPLLPGQAARLTLTLEEPAPVAPGWSFSLLQGGRAIGQGRILEVK